MNIVKIKARVRAVINNPEIDLILVGGELIDLHAQMVEINAMPNKVEAIIRLFQVISPLHDKCGFSQLLGKLRSKNFGQLDVPIKALELLQQCIHNSGRCEYGWNRTKPGEIVTPANVYLGDVFGIWTHSAEFWLQNQSRFENEKSGATPTPESGLEYVSVWYCINDYQAGAFVRKNVEGILKGTSELLKFYYKK